MRRTRHLHAFALSTAVLACSCGGSEPSPVEPEEPGPFRPGLVQAFLNLRFERPVALSAAPDESLRLYVAERRGLLHVFDNDLQVEATNVYLDLRDRVLDEAGAGILGFAFHPDYARNGQVYVHYVADHPRRSVLSRFHLGAEYADPASEEILLEVPQPDARHYGGAPAFGPDGYLYVALGDGGPEGDPEDRAQDPTSLQGSLLRIDVDRRDAGRAYAVPPDNPLAGNTKGLRPEIWAWGFRDPGAISFDAPTGRLWLVDRGPELFDELDISEPGRNYGWSVMEGSRCHAPPQGCETAGLQLPVLDYGGSRAGRAIVGGFVYRGARNPELTGRYLFADFASGQLWTVFYDGATPASAELLVSGKAGYAAIGVDPQGEPVIANETDGRLYRLRFSTS